MAFCRYCGSRLNDYDKFCPNCGAAVANERNGSFGNNYGNVNSGQNTPYGADPLNYSTPDAPSGRISAGMLVWSIINIVLCCAPFGVWALVMTILAKNAPSAEEEHRKLRIARTVNIVSTILGVVMYIVYIIYIAFLAAAGIIFW